MNRYYVLERENNDSYPLFSSDEERGTQIACGDIVDLRPGPVALRLGNPVPGGKAGGTSRTNTSRTNGGVAKVELADDDPTHALLSVPLRAWAGVNPSGPDPMDRKAVL